MIPFFRLDCARERTAARASNDTCIRTPRDHAISPRLPVVALEKKGIDWPDCLGADHSSIPIFFSEDVVRAVEKAGLVGLAAAEVEIDPRQNAKLAATAAGRKYFQVWPTGHALSYRHRAFETVKDGSNVAKDYHYEFRFETSDPADPRLVYGAMPFDRVMQVAPILESWDGSDFLRVNAKSAIGMMGGFICSRRVVEIAREHNWSNFSFTPIDFIGRLGTDFRKLPWPPEKWYGEKQPSLFSEPPA